MEKAASKLTLRGLPKTINLHIDGRSTYIKTKRTHYHFTRMRQRLLTFLLATFIFFSTLVAQDSNIDSLRNKLTLTNNDSARAEILLKMANSKEHTDIAEGIEYLNQAIKLFGEKINPHRRARLLNKIGYRYWKIGKFIEANGHYSEALAIFEELGDKHWRSLVSNNVGTIHWGLNNYNEALAFYQKALKLRIENNEEKGIALFLNNIGLIYQKWNLFDDALNYHQRALKLTRKNKNIFGEAYSYMNIGSCYELQGDFKEALSFYQSALNTYKSDNQKEAVISESLEKIGNIYFKLNRTDEAISYFSEALKNAEQINHQFHLAIAEYDLARCYHKLNKDIISRKYIENSLKRAETHSYNNLIHKNYLLYSRIEEEAGNTIKALKYFKASTEIKEGIFNRDKAAKFTRLETSYQLEQQKLENVLLRKDNEIQQMIIDREKKYRNGLLLAGLFVIFFLSLIYRSRVSFKKMNRQLEKKNRNILEISQEKEQLIGKLQEEIEIRRTAESRLSASESKYRLMVESSRDAIVIIQNNKLIFHNQAFRQMLNYTPEELLLISYSEIHTSFTSTKSEDHDDHKSDTPEDIPKLHNSTFKKKDGNLIYTAAKFSNIEYEGQKAIFAIIRDVTEQNEILSLLQTSTGQTSRLKDIIPICASCNKIRDDKSREASWLLPAAYIANYMPETKFTHGMCPECKSKWYKDNSKT